MYQKLLIIISNNESNFFESIGSQKCTKNAIFPQGGAFKVDIALKRQVMSYAAGLIFHK